LQDDKAIIAAGAFGADRCNILLQSLVLVK